ncbi:aspartate/glutamate racemase family protein [Noviherbaspirillum sp. ST9]|uniref:aspartate/glutamate racemase family protein n=1 Tax=Noviherbaspirillum sp. ST9 TaxID=3401606 RepID=UPI003B587774
MKSPISPTIGVVSSLGLGASGALLDLLAEECRSQYGARHDSDFPRTLVAMETVPDNGDANDVLRNAMWRLEQAGADFLALACDSAPVHLPNLAESVGVRVLNPIDLMLEAIPLSAQRIALVAPQSVVASEIFQRALWRGGHRLVDPGWQQEIDSLITTARLGGDTHRLERRWVDFLGSAAEAGVDTVLVSCFALSRVARQVNAALHVADGAHCLARGIVAEWLAWCVEE